MYLPVLRYRGIAVRRIGCDLDSRSRLNELRDFFSESEKAPPNGPESVFNRFHAGEIPIQIYESLSLRLGDTKKTGEIRKPPAVLQHVIPENNLRLYTDRQVDKAGGAPV